MSLPAPTAATMPDDGGADCIDPATSLKIGSITYDWNENGYNLE